MAVNLYQGIQGNVGNSVICKNLIEAYRKDKSSVLVSFLEFFMKALGTEGVVDPEGVATSMQDGSLVDFLNDILRGIKDYDEEQYIFDDDNDTTLKRSGDFIRAFCGTDNPMLRDDAWMTLLAVCLSAIAKFSTEFTMSVGIYFSLKIAHDLEMLRGEKASSHAFCGTEEETQLKRNIAKFLENTNSDTIVAVSRMCFDHISRLFCTLIRSSNEIYLRELSILEQAMHLILVKHRATRDVLSLFTEILTHSTSSAMKSHLVKYLSNYTGIIVKLANQNSVPTQVAAVKFILTAQRFLGGVSFLQQNDKDFIYSKMFSSSNKLREAATQFFRLTHSKFTDGRVEKKRTMLEALIQLCENYEDFTVNLTTMVKVLEKHFTRFDEFTDEVCRTKKPIAYKILFYRVKRLMEPDIDDDQRHGHIDEFLLKFTTVAAPCEQDSLMGEIMLDTLLQMDFEAFTASPEHAVALQQVGDFILRALLKVTCLQTLYMIHMLLQKLMQFAKEKTEIFIDRMARRFVNGARNEEVTIHLCAALRIQKIADMLSLKRQQDLWRAIRDHLSESGSHTKANVHHVLAIYAELLSSHWKTPLTADDDEHIEEVDKFIFEHLIPFMTTDIREDKLFNQQVMQAFSLIIINFVVNCPTEGYQVWNNVQPTVLKHVVEVVFAAPYDDTTEGIWRNSMNALLIALRHLQTTEHPIHISFAKIIIHLAKSSLCPDVLQEAMQLVTNDLTHGVRIFGSVCYNFTFSQEEKSIRSFFLRLDQLIASFHDADKGNSFRLGIILRYIENVGKYIEISQESEDENAAKLLNRLAVLKFIKDFLEPCTENQKKDIVAAQQRFINVNYLNSREKDALKAFNPAAILSN